MHNELDRRIGKSPLSTLLVYLWVCRIGWWGLVTTILLPVICVVVITGIICCKYHLSHWFLKYDTRVDMLVSAHFNLIAFILTFTGGVIFVFKDKQWNETKCDALKNHIDALTFEVIHNRKASDEEDKQYSAFHSVLKGHVGPLDERFRRLYTLFIWCILLISSTCLSSVILAYHARLAQNVLCYRLAYMLAVTAITLAVLHLFIVLVPVIMNKLMKRALDRKAIRKFFIRHQDRVAQLGDKGDNPSDSMRFLDG